MNKREMEALLAAKGLRVNDLVQYVNDPEGWPQVAMPAVIALFTIIKETP